MGYEFCTSLIGVRIFSQGSQHDQFAFDKTENRISGLVQNRPENP